MCHSCWLAGNLLLLAAPPPPRTARRLGLRGDAIPLLAQVIGIVDVYDALTTARPYKPPLPRDRARDELRDEAD